MVELTHFDIVQKAWKWKCWSLSHVRLFVSPWTVTHQAPLCMGFFRQNTGVGCHSLLQGIFLTQGSSLGLLHCRQIFYHLSYKEHGAPWAPWLQGAPSRSQFENREIILHLRSWNSFLLLGHYLVYPFQSILVCWFLECQRSLLPSPVWPLPICLDSST